MAGIAQTSRLVFGARRGAFSIAVAGSISVGVMLSPSPVEAGCSDWNATGEFTFVQTNRYSPKFKLNQTGSDIHGTAEYKILDYNLNGRPVTASVDGYIQGDNFEVTAYWNNDTAGVYSGRIGAQGRIEGSTYDKRHPDAMARWHSEPTLSCGPPVAAPASGPAAEWEKRAKSAADAAQPRNNPKPPIPYCDNYAASAVAAAKESLRLNCGFTGPRWSDVIGGHLNWCLALGGDRTAPSSEEAARAEGLGACRAKIAARQKVITEEPAGATDRLFQMKPN